MQAKAVHAAQSESKRQHSRGLRKARIATDLVPVRLVRALDGKAFDAGSPRRVQHIASAARQPVILQDRLSSAGKTTRTVNGSVDYSERGCKTLRTIRWQWLS